MQFYRIRVSIGTTPPSHACKAVGLSAETAGRVRAEGRAAPVRSCLHRGPRFVWVSPKPGHPSMLISSVIHE